MRGYTRQTGDVRGPGRCGPYTAAGAGREGFTNSWAAVTGLDAVKPLRLGPPRGRLTPAELTCAQSQTGRIFRLISVHVIPSVNVNQTSRLNSNLSLC
jgi:hypothetical protein